MKDFVKFLSHKTFSPIEIPEDIIHAAFRLTVEDNQYHFPAIGENAVHESIIRNGDELPVFLYRLGTLVRSSNISQKEIALRMLHGIMKEVCSCEVYFNNYIGRGFLIVHGEGTVIGSRNTIGKGFIIHQGCTIGHKKNGMGKPSGQGCQIGNNVTMYVNSTIIGELEIGDNVVIGAHTLVKENIPANARVINRVNQEIIL